MPGFSYRQPLARKTRAPSTDDDSSNAGHHGDDGKPKTFGRGIVADFKRTIGTWWLKEMTNFNTKTIAVSLFLFIAVIAPTITFGAVYAKATNNYIGAVELLLATAWCGIFYALVSGQPMVCLIDACWICLDKPVLACPPPAFVTIPSHSQENVIQSLTTLFSFLQQIDDQWWYWTSFDLPSRLL